VKYHIQILCVFKIAEKLKRIKLRNDYFFNHVLEHKTVYQGIQNLAIEHLGNGTPSTHKAQQL